MSLSVAVQVSGRYMSIWSSHILPFWGGMMRDYYWQKRQLGTGARSIESSVASSSSSSTSSLNNDRTPVLPQDQRISFLSSRKFQRSGMKNQWNTPKE